MFDTMNIKFEVVAQQMAVTELFAYSKFINSVCDMCWGDLSL
jgi:hypothetical protein